MSINAWLPAYAEQFRTLTPQRLGLLDGLFTEGARFKDPFNDVRGVAAIRQVFRHMYDTLHNPRFMVLDMAGSGFVGYLHWQFRFSTEPAAPERCITGMSRVVFDIDGKVVEHLDFWDPAEQLYATLPILGRVLAWLRGRLSATAG